MSLAEKMQTLSEQNAEKSANNITIAENVPKIYNAGKIDFGRKKSVSGENLHLDDINPNEHKLDVTLRSINLFNVNGSLTDRIGYTTGDVTLLEDGKIKATSNFAIGRGTGQYITVSPNTTYTIQYIVDAFDSIGTGSVIQILCYSDDDEETIVANSISTWTGSYAKTFTTLDDTEYIWVSFNGAWGVDSGYTIYDKVQLVEGDATKPYTPFVSSYEDVNVTAYGKNLFNIFNLSSTSAYTVNEDGTVTIKGGNKYVWTPSTLGQLCPRLKVGDKFTFSFSKTGIQEFYVGGTAAVYLQQGKTYTATEEMLSNNFIIYGQRDTEADYAEEHTIYFIQVELDEKVTEPQEYIGATYTPNADGTVEGVTSISPIMNIFADTTGVIINADYYQDVENFNNDNERLMWYGLITGEGQRIDYSFCLRDAIFHFDTFNPPYKMGIKYGAYLFFNTKGLKKIITANFDLSNLTNANYMFCRGEIEEIGDLDLGNNTAMSQFSMWQFADMYNCHTIGVITLPTNGLNGRTTEPPFWGLYALKNISFEGGTINTSISFQHSSRLTVESAKSIITHLKDFNALTCDEGAWNYVITFHSNTWALLENEGETAPNGTTWKQYVSHKKWDYA